MVKLNNIKDGNYFVYMALNDRHEVVYVGMTNTPDLRARHHKRDKEWFGNVSIFKVAGFKTKNDAHIYEIYYISKYNPIYNKYHKHSNVTIILEEATFYDFEINEKNGGLIDFPIIEIFKSQRRNSGIKICHRDKVEICRLEVQKIRKIKEKHCRAVMFSLLIHSKLYDTSDNSIYMTYNEILYNSGVRNKNNIKSAIDRLIEYGYITIKRRNIYKTPNEYIINIKNKRKKNVVLEITDFKKSYIEYFNKLLK